MQRRRSLRYRAQMKKTLRKLVVRGETIRVLRTLDLRNIAGADGGAARPFESTGTCPIQAVVATVRCH